MKGTTDLERYRHMYTPLLFFVSNQHKQEHTEHFIIMLQMCITGTQEK